MTATDQDTGGSLGLLASEASFSRLDIVLAAMLTFDAIVGFIMLWGVAVNGPLRTFIETSGRFIPTGDVINDYALGCVWWIVLACVCWALPVNKRNKRLLLIGWAIKMPICLMAMLPYEGRYQYLDAYDYFRAAHDTSLIFSGDRFGIGYTTPNACAWLLLHLGPDSFHALKLTFAFLGLLATLLTAAGIARLVKVSVTAAFFALLLWPSYLFWTSILGKDPLIALGIGLYIYGMRSIPLLTRSSVITVLFGVLLVASIRIWIAGLLVAGFAAALFMASRRAKAVTIPQLFVLTIVGGLAVESFLMFHGPQLLEHEYSYMDNNWVQARSALAVSVDRTDPVAIAMFLPYGQAIALFAPFPWQAHNAFSAVAAAESSLVILMILYALWRARSSDFLRPVPLWSLTIIAVWSVLYAFVSYRDLGGAVRYRVQIIPFIVICLFQAIHSTQRSSRTRAAA